MKILVADFRGELPDEISDALRARGHELRVVSTLSAFDEALRDSFDLAVMDCAGRSPGELLQGLDHRGDTPILGWTVEAEVNAAMQAGFDDVLLTAPAALWELRFHQAASPAAHRRSEAALRASEKLLTEITDQIPGVVYRFVMEPDGRTRVPFVSRRLEELFGVDPEAAARDFGSFFSLVVEEDLDEVRDSIMRSAQTMTPWDCEFRIDRDGEIRWLLGHSLPREGEGGSVVWHGMIQDITERKRFEDRLRIADRLASVGTLAAGIAHEINNPLSFVTSNLASILDELPDLPRDELRSLLEACLRGTHRIEEIVGGLRSFAYVKDTTPQPLDLCQVLEDALQIAGSKIRGKATLVVDFVDTPPVIGRRNDLVQVFVNLLINAVQAMDGTDEETNRIDITVERDPDDASQVRISVTDNGHGIPKDRLTTIFDPFYTTKGIGEGTGLGLYISHTLLTGMNGRIEVESAEGVGTTFRIFLPILNSPDD